MYYRKYQERRNDYVESRNAYQRRDCHGLNAAMRGVAKSLFNQCSEVEIYGFTDGYKGLIYGEYRLLKMMIFQEFITLAEQSLEVQECLLNISVFA